VDGGPVDERRRREPRAHRFQAVESTLAFEQPSPFAGWRSVGSLSSERSGLLWVKGDARSSDLEIYFERNRNNVIDMPDGHSSLVSDPAAMTEGARRAKEEGTATHHVGTIELASTPTLKECGKPRLRDVHCNLRSALRSPCRSCHPKKVGLVFETNQRCGARFSHTARASVRRERNMDKENLNHARGSSAQRRARVSY